MSYKRRLPQLHLEHSEQQPKTTKRKEKDRDGDREEKEHYKRCFRSIYSFPLDIY